MLLKMHRVNASKQSIVSQTTCYVAALCCVAGLLHVKFIAPGAARLLRFWRQQRQAAARAAAARRFQTGPGRPPPAAAGPAASIPVPASTAAAAATAAQQRIQAQQWRGIPSRGEQQQQGHRVGGNGEDGAGVSSSSSRALSAEELRLRRLQRFS